MPVYLLAFAASTLSWIGGKTWANVGNWWNGGSQNNTAASVISGQQTTSGISTMRLFTVAAILFGGALLLREFMKIWRS